MTEIVIVIAAHADDEVLGCGGTIARHVAEGDQVTVVFLADGVSSRDHTALDEQRRLSAAEAAAECLGVRDVRYLNLPDNRMDTLPLLDIVKSLEAELEDLGPTVIYTHHAGDLNIDHQITQRAVMTLYRPQPGCLVRRIYAFEVMSSTEWSNPQVNPFIPVHYVDISNYIAEKEAALQAYADEMRDAPHSRSIEHMNALSLHRGHCVGVMAAEAFIILRSIV